MKLRPYQTEVELAAMQQWQAGKRNVLLVMPTGAGKTVTLSNIIKKNVGDTFAIAHRQELVGQISTALAREGIKHNIIAPAKVVKLCVNLHMEAVGRSFFSPHARCYVAGVDTLVRRSISTDNVTLWVMDEAHHVLKDNKWGKAVDMFPNARGLGVTATPLRTDGSGLGAHADGYFDAMVVGPNMRELINMFYLTDYRVFAPPSDLDLSDVKISERTGDYNKNGLGLAIKRSRIIGDIVDHYMRIAPGKLGISFLPDVESATITAQKFREAGLAAEVVHAKTPDFDRVAILRKFARREIQQLVNVDLFGEGFDLPALEVVSMGRPTQSYGLYVQQFGRALRPIYADGYDLDTAWGREMAITNSCKPKAIVIDHVGNVIRHGLPDAPKDWSLDKRERRSSGAKDIIPCTSCPSCTGAYEKIHKICPYCGFYPEPVSRNAPEFVDGDLTELDAATLAEMRGEVSSSLITVEQFNQQQMAKGVPYTWRVANTKRHGDKLEAQGQLRDTIAQWAGYQTAAGRGDSESYRLFYHKFGIDVLSAQTLNTKDTIELEQKIRRTM